MTDRAYSPFLIYSITILGPKTRIYGDWFYISFGFKVDEELILGFTIYDRI